MAQALPSFVELLSSLDLESEGGSEGQHHAHYPTSPSFISSSPSSSLPSLPSSQASSARFLYTPNSPTSFASPSPSIVISQPSPIDGSVAPRRRSMFNRYNPYVPPSALIRRSSLPGDLMNHHDFANLGTASRSCSESPPVRRVSLEHECPNYQNTSRITISNSDQPISALVRRRQPHYSPQSSEFHKPPARRRSISPTATLMPMSLPSLPPLPRISPKLESPSLLFSATPLPPASHTLDYPLNMSLNRDARSPGAVTSDK